jgi:hypothetical protein
MKYETVTLFEFFRLLLAFYNRSNWTSGHAVSKVFQALNPEETTLQCTVYRSTDENPRFITDPTCQRLGILTIQLQIQCCHLLLYI